jgi:hypothetical protein
LFNFNYGGNPTVGNFPAGYPQQPGFNPSAFGIAPAGGPQGPAQIMAVLQTLLSSLSQLAAGWSGALGNPYGQPGFPPQYPGFPQPGPQFPPQYPGFPPQYPPVGYPTQPPIGYPPQPPIGYPQQPPIGFPPQPPTYGGNPNVPRYPSDPRDFASYLQAQIAGGSLNGGTGIAQRDAIPGTRFGQVQDPTGWQASVARNYAYQFAAYAVGADPLSPAGLAQGAQAMENMSPDAQLFTQVASVFKGNLLQGPGFYDNAKLKQLLVSRGLGNLATDPQVGQTDVQTIGAITQALNSGQISLQDVLNSGSIDNMDRYFEVIRYVQSGGFNKDLSFYDTVPV